MRLGEVIALGTRSAVHSWGADLVAKVPFPSTPDSWIRYEAEYTAAVRAAGATAPKVVDLLEIEGRLVGVYERVVGPSMWDCVRAAPDQASDMGAVLAGLHLEILQLSAPVSLPRQQDRLAAKIRRAAAVVDPDVHAALALIPDMAWPLQLCHGDLHPGNVLMADPRPVLIDWFDACRGSAVGDVARSSLLMGSGGATTRSIDHLPGADRKVLASFHQAYLESIATQVAIDPANFVRWKRINAAARLAEGLESPASPAGAGDLDRRP
jgi:tRNA A-37 threonylcarbamoyl transferase component Bud32